MRKTKLYLLLLLITFLIMCGKGEESPETPEDQEDLYLRIIQDAPMYQEPDTDSEVSGIFEAGTQVYSFEHRSGGNGMTWYHCEAPDGSNLWVQERYVNILGSSPQIGNGDPEAQAQTPELYEELQVLEEIEAEEITGHDRPQARIDAYIEENIGYPERENILELVFSEFGEAQERTEETVQNRHYPDVEDKLITLEYSWGSLEFYQATMSERTMIMTARITEPVFEMLWNLNVEAEGNYLYTLFGRGRTENREITYTHSISPVSVTFSLDNALQIEAIEFNWSFP
ncbi:MAG: hypothetical protein ACLFR1_04255 [Spirochaetia bacterium]